MNKNQNEKTRTKSYLTKKIRFKQHVVVQQIRVFEIDIEFIVLSMKKTHDFLNFSFLNVNDFVLTKIVNNLNLIVNLIDDNEMYRVKFEKIEITKKKIYATRKKNEKM